jgi:putative membrane protein
MQPVFQAALRSWSVPPAATFAIVLSALIYLRGWWLLRCAGVPFLPAWRAASFLSGLFALWFALASPLDVLNGFLLTAHMSQHMVLMMIAPPLVLLGAPLIPMVRGLPIFAAREFAGPFLNWPLAQRIGNTLIHPVIALLLMSLAMFAWHTPALYELALRSSAWHQTEHACFFLTSLIFWWPVVQPWPSREQWPRWAMVPYLLVADLENTALSAILVFSDRVIYPSYATVPRLFGFSALDDQAAAGAMMWVIGSLAFIVPAIAIAIQCLSRKPSPESFTPPRRRDTSRWDDFWSPVSHFAKARWSGARVEALTFIVLFAIAGFGFARLLSGGANDDDNQALRFQAASGPFAVAVFAPSRALAAGSSLFSVLVRDRRTQDVLLDSTVDLTARPSANPQGQSSAARASHTDSGNKLLQSADLDLPSVGDWTLQVTIHRDSQAAEFSWPISVLKAETGFTSPWPYIVTLAFAAILLFAYFRRHRTPKALSPAGIEAPGDWKSSKALNSLADATRRTRS